MENGYIHLNAYYRSLNELLSMYVERGLFKDFFVEKKRAKESIVGATKSGCHYG